MKITQMEWQPCSDLRMRFEAMPHSMNDLDKALRCPKANALIAPLRLCAFAFTSSF